MGAVMKMDGSPLDQRPLPSNIEAEQELIGAVLLKNEHYGRIAGEIAADDFYDPLHREVWDLIAGLIEAGKLASPVTVKPHLEGLMVGDLPIGSYLARLVADCPLDPSAVSGIAKAIADLSLRRREFLILEEALGRILDNRVEDTGVTILDDIMGELESTRPTRAGQSGFVSFDKSAQKAIDKASAAYARGGVLPGLSTGLIGLDDALGGLNKTDLITIAGRPAMGKSAIATNIAYAVGRDLLAKRQAGEKTGVVGVISLEMSDDQVAGRILSERSYVSTHRLRRGKASEKEMEQFIAAAEELRSLPIETDSTPYLSISQITLRARNLAKRKGLELLIIDYVQIVQGSGKKSENRVRELSEITAGLKWLAKELEVPVVILAQVGRQVEQRPDKRPRLSDLKESGSIEQDSDVVMFLYRHEYYLKPEEPRPGTQEHAQWQDDMDRARGRADIIIAKNRHGPEETIHVGFDANVTRFKDELPEEVAAAPREKRERQEKRSFKAKSPSALQVLRGLTITASIENDGHVNARKGTRIVPYSVWKAKCAEDHMDPDRTEASIATQMETSLRDLRGDGTDWPPLVLRGGSREESYVWLTEAGSK